MEARGRHFKIVRLDGKVGFARLELVEDTITHSDIAVADRLLRNPNGRKGEKPIVSDGTVLHVFPGERAIRLDSDITGTCVIEGVASGDTKGIQRVRRDTARTLAQLLQSPIEASIPFGNTEVFDP